MTFSEYVNSHPESTLKFIHKGLDSVARIRAKDINESRFLIYFLSEHKTRFNMSKSNLVDTNGNVEGITVGRGLRFDLKDPSGLEFSLYTEEEDAINNR